MTKLEFILAKIKELTPNEQEEVASMLASEVSKTDEVFSLTEAELAELDRRLTVLDAEPTFSTNEVFAKFAS